METVSSVLLLASPFVIKWITTGVKKVLSVDLSNTGRKVILRTIVAVLAFGATVGTAALNGGDVDATSIATFADTLIVFVGSTGFYFWSRFKK